MFRYICFALIVLYLFRMSEAAARTEPEISRAWCDEAGGEIEYVLYDRTRVDCLLDDYAIEFDWGTKWAEGLGQALHYAANTGRRAGVMLILKKPTDIRYHERLDRLVKHYGLPVDVWFMFEGDDDE